MRDNLTIAILLNHRKIPLWIFRTIDNILRVDSTNVIIVVSKPPASTRRHNGRNFPGLLILRLIEKIDYLIFRTEENYHRLKDVAHLHHQVNTFELNRETMASGRQNGLAEKLRELNPDIIIKFGYHILPESLQDLPRFGIWTLPVESDDVPGDFDFGFWEVVRYRNTSVSSVRALTPGALRAEIIYRSVESTCPFSVNKNRNQIFHRTALFLPRLIQGLQFGGEGYLTGQKERHRNSADAGTETEISLELVSVIKDTFGFIGRVSQLVLNKLLYTDAFSWNILVHMGTGKDPVTEGFERFRQLKSPDGVFWADPFVAFEAERYYIFVEEFIYRRNKAHISVLELGPGGDLVKCRKVIEQPYHMSYPFVFKEDCCWYMIPETASNSTIELYRCTGFPYSWEIDKVIMSNISATDTTLFFYNGKWWLFTTLDQTGSVSGGSTELFLFYADNLHSDNWVSHPLNPVVSDETGARCAGNLFIRNGIIYRPSQDCSVRYGRGFNLKRVTVLSESEYNEITENEIKPFWDKKLKGTHTFNFANGLTVIDTYRFHSRF